jgi:hypothetical protein
MTFSWADVALMSLIWPDLLFGGERLFLAMILGAPGDAVRMAADFTMDSAQ